MMWIEKSVARVTDRHREACRVMGKVMGRTRTGTTEAYAQSLSVDCDLDLRPSDMVLVRDNRLVRMIICAKLFFNSHHA